MRQITSHVVNPANDKITVQVMDTPGPGGANHAYDIVWGQTQTENVQIRFQKGGIAENGVNGLTHEVLLAILIDRLAAFQSGPFKCEENRVALEHLELALETLKSRTRARMNRGVEGKFLV